MQLKASVRFVRRIDDDKEEEEEEKKKEKKKKKKKKKRKKKKKKMKKMMIMRRRRKRQKNMTKEKTKKRVRHQQYTRAMMCGETVLACEKGKKSSFSFFFFAFGEAMRTADWNTFLMKRREDDKKDFLPGHCRGRGDSLRKEEEATEAPSYVPREGNEEGGEGRGKEVDEEGLELSVDGTREEGDPSM
ncbi:uncharacterized protein MONOS_16133 [Monocercomonoides exilis]|uniref:uncharacterized protein n=1 Tax=Monocercomonoides exilis TaxID=2049356 RepID=UPI00355A9CEF|nr:hypothetical protein MONOS_16133 [Monocercomonoides exilis]|eukprot:MONOS_16133.1-p1 / transcript=MONOS_16133.1 / gene=MONOS_16133 / organism=Monocercomonoides_exilis_PA203 / gene_product=unspecified product / transcript_product=unspecified product / location=Mono_scaffold01520:4220-4851(+) / protein_length=188 / sequence_SO=supercontig / SO=protein_coding / is_pseudo=false